MVIDKLQDRGWHFSEVRGPSAGIDWNHVSILLGFQVLPRFRSPSTHDRVGMQSIHVGRLLMSHAGLQGRVWKEGYCGLRQGAADERGFRGGKKPRFGWVSFSADRGETAQPPG